MNDPTPDELAAIVAAIEVAWPKPVSAASPVTSRPPSWRFAGRWWTKPIPIRRERPW